MMHRCGVLADVSGELPQWSFGVIWVLSVVWWPLCSCWGRPEVGVFVAGKCWPL